MKHFFKGIAAVMLLLGQAAVAQNGSYWQQHVDYTMEVDMNVDNFQYTGTQKLVYTNNSPDELSRVYYHLFFNAFQPGSEMDMRLQSIPDPDGRMTDDQKKSRIASLKESEIGYLHVNSLTQDGVKVDFVEEETILVVELAQPIPPGGKTTFEMEFKGQVPLQVRRAGRNSAEGVALSMSQWYPKLAEYDFEGWHADPYIAREFHGVWGDFDVKLTLDKKYVVGGTGYLQNPQEIGHGYEAPGTKVKKQKGKTLTWHFKAPMVHDFMWAADPDYIHDTLQVENGPTLHFLYKDNKEIIDNWKKLQPKTAELMKFFNKNIGEYPYEQYSVIQGGDGGMEYAMATLITGERKFGSLVGVTAHEMAHSWFQHILASNESKHEWMDEGFTTFISSLAMNEVMQENKENPFEGTYKGYYSLVNSGKEQPQTTHADRYDLNFAYGIAAYSKGSIFLSQLGYVIGQDKLMETLRKYYEDFKFKHPTPNDIKRTAEKVSGMELDWYLTDWTQTTNTIDYGITDVKDKEGKTEVSLVRKGAMPMPIDILVIYEDGTKETFYAPLRMMRGEKENPYPQINRTVLEDWPWAQSNYSFTFDKPLENVKAVVIDPSQLMADIDLEDNVWQKTP
ncbi:M1 family metallopeptidase [Zobellia galactanivorans]|uniref:Aminopeptidase, family M1 n=1 Tax=Zobellia galactanivorans (strain DSM 12802 / CCUG 47099 / CIP 106680 / NCIMB 13871 / Dsij) TaxID=63186 RepID=G0LB16_ZOBGA|nr:M1 family metallopeptidase [Zobellia galactanivorans]MDO6809109.1 M1 family metallopeptidase [Zobellia galactanivorans]CAZ95733.1 Aminopeptidase, family M1 [Zobellia galactanivorans]